MIKNLFITGATGFLGAQILIRLLQCEETHVYALVRARDEEHLCARKKDFLAKYPEIIRGDRLTFVKGDITKPGFNLESGDRGMLVDQVSSILHVAASTRFDLTKKEAELYNILGGSSVVSLSQEIQNAGNLDRLDYVSTCYVGGDRRGRFFESECDEGQTFRNTYEWSKCVAENHLRKEMEKGLRATIHRPSIIIGDSRNGAAKAFTAMYTPIKVYARGLWRTLPGNPDSLLDLVPVDYVSDAILKLRETDHSLGSCFHIAAGDDAITIDDVVTRLGKYIEAKPVRYFDPDRWRRFVHPLAIPFFNLTKNGRRVRNVIESFLPYFSGNPMFDTSNRSSLLGDFKPPSALDYLDKVMRYAVEKDFQE